MKKYADKYRKLRNQSRLLNDDELRCIVANGKYKGKKPDLSLLKSNNRRIIMTTIFISTALLISYFLLYEPMPDHEADKPEKPAVSKELKAFNKNDKEPAPVTKDNKKEPGSREQKIAKTDAIHPVSSLISGFALRFNANMKQATAQYRLNSKQNISISLHDMNGKFIKTILDKQDQKPGQYNVHINLIGLEKISYLIYINSDDKIILKKKISIK